LIVYKNDKRLHEILREGTMLEYKWFHQMDLWYGSRENIKNEILANAIKEDVVNFSPRDLTTLMLELHKQHKKRTSLTKAKKSKGFLEQVITNNENKWQPFKKFHL